MTIMKQQPGKCSRYSNSLRAGRSRVRILVGTRDYLCSKNRPDRLWGPPGLLTMVLFREGGGGSGREATYTSLQILPNLWMCGATPLLPIRLCLWQCENLNSSPHIVGTVGCVQRSRHLGFSQLCGTSNIPLSQAICSSASIPQSFI
jgi:hypothetical protein